MDMKISAIGTVPAGEYENISVSGSAKIVGLVRCSGLHVSGKVKGEAVECSGTIKISGMCKLGQGAEAKDLHISGSFSCTDITAEETVSVSGIAKCTGFVRCGKLSVSGIVKSGSEIKCTEMSVSGMTECESAEAENVNVRGVLTCEGLLNAENILIEFEEGMTIGSIGGSKIIIRKRFGLAQTANLPLFSTLTKQKRVGAVCVKNAVEGDDIALECVVCERVSGRTVAIGDGCEIGLVQYTDQIEISPNAKVGRTEKIGE